MNTTNTNTNRTNGLDQLKIQLFNIEYLDRGLKGDLLRTLSLLGVDRSEDLKRKTLSKGRESKVHYLTESKTIFKRSDISEDPIYKSINDFTGADIKELYELGYTMSLEEYLELTKRINPNWMAECTLYINGLHPIYKWQGKHSNIMAFIINWVEKHSDIYTESIKNGTIQQMTEEVVEKLLMEYLLYYGIKNGFLDNDKNPSSLDLNKVVYEHEVVDLYIIINGGFDITPDDDYAYWKMGSYNKINRKVSYPSIKYMVRNILENQPELIGLRNLRINRDALINELLD